MGYAGPSNLRIGKVAKRIVCILEVIHPEMKNTKKNRNYVQAPHFNLIALWIRIWDSGETWTAKQVWQKPEMYDWKERDETQLDQDASRERKYDITRGGINEAAYLPRACRDLGTAKIATLVENKLTDFCPRNQPSISHSTKHHGVLRRCGDARGGADAHECRLQPAAVRNLARFPRPRTPTFRARRILFTSCQTARPSAHRALHVDGPDTKARACSPRHANAQALGDGTEQ